MPDFPNIILYAIPFFITAMTLELYVITKAKFKSLKGYKVEDALASIAMGLGNVFLGFLSKALVLLIFFWVYNNYRIFEIPITGWSFVLLFFADDFSYYWFHRISHECRLFWASHVIHHSSEHYNLSVSFRLSWTQNLKLLFFLIISYDDEYAFHLHYYY